MQRVQDPYELLGTTRTASLAEVREAYHAAVLLCHPDRRPDDPDAVRAFERVVEAYRAILGWRGMEGADEPVVSVAPVSPRELALRAQGPAPAWAYAPTPAPLHWACHRIRRPTRDEPAVFAAIWLVALLAGLSVEWLLVGRLPSDFRDRGEGPVWMAMIVLAPLLVYAGIVALAVAVPVMTRKAVYLVTRFSRGPRRALPCPRSSPSPPAANPKLS